MKKQYWLIFLSLLIALFIYLFYRTEKTVINQLLIALISAAKYAALKSFITSHLPLSGHVIYSLPEGLWVFCITLTSKHFFFQAGNRKISCVLLPLVFSIGLEIFQLLHLTNGRFDLWDIGASVFFWLVARYLVPLRLDDRNIFTPVTRRSILCISSYAIVFLAHVWQ